MKHDVIVPSAGESVTEVYIGEWRKKTGDLVKKDEVLVELETQKATFELRAERSGRIEVLKPERDEVVKPGDVIAVIDDSAASDADRKAEVPTGERPKAEAKSEPLLSPAARKIAAEKHIDADALKGTGKGGRVTKEDVQRTSPSPSTSSSPSAGPTSAQVAAPIKYHVDVGRGEWREPATRIRRQIAQNLVAAQHTAAILTTFNEADMSQVMAFRKKNKEKFKEKHGVSLGVVGLFALASVRALKEYPLVNSTFTGDEVISRDFVDISVAVSTERGLVVPVMRDVDQMNLVDFEKKLGELSVKAQQSKLSIPEMSGGTFTISNGGVFGSLLSTPILNMPQSAILGLHKIQDRPVAVEGKVEIRPMMYLALSYDHRLIDGRDAVLFLVKIKEGIENISLIVNEKEI
ncbi:MAG TPA: 2-oxoglutarate dehydrogenase complex dihydrolipoyllysine-residue succinyltransferase [bacterium]|nr:2-oxoglutarate dehydrogenase complex dihydrolipoyllysine-residue succinyltransferase [bacterium]